MPIKCGIIGLPNVGKSALFNNLTGSNILSANFPFATKDANHGMAYYYDNRVKTLANFYDCTNVLYDSCHIIDIAGLVKGASSGVGMGNKFLSDVQQADALIHVVRCFYCSNIINTSYGSPCDDLNVVNEELIMKDLQVVEGYLKSKSVVKKPILSAAHDHLLNMRLLSNFNDVDKLAEYNLLTAKPMIVIANHDGTLSDNFKILLRDVDYISCNTADYGDHHFVIKECMKRLSIITYLTSSKKETRNWLIKRGSTAREAAGVIHSDFSRKFIRGQIYHYSDIALCDKVLSLRNKGLIRTESADYIMKDGDVAHWLVR